MKFFFLFFFIFSCTHITAPQRPQTGLKVVWAKNLDSNHETGNLSITTGSPRIFNEIVYQGSLSGTMFAFDLESGRELWSSQENGGIVSPVESFNDHVAYGTLTGRLFVRHYLTGKLKYAIDLGAPVESAPFFYQDRLILYLRGHQIVQLDAETGKILWSYSRSIPITTTLQRTTRPLVIGNKVIVGFADGYVGALSFQEGVILWETKIVEQSKFVDVDLNPLKSGNLVITGSPSGTLKAINPENGDINRDFGVNVISHPVLRGEQLLLGTGNGEVVLLGLDGETLKKVKVSKLAVSAVTWWKEHIAASSFDGKIYFIDPITFQVKEEFSLGHEFSTVYSDLATHKDYLAFMTSRNRLYLMK
jgi:outer membrane protein assembly factor BamB